MPQVFPELLNVLCKWRVAGFFTIFSLLPLLSVSQDISKAGDSFSAISVRNYHRIAHLNTLYLCAYNDGYIRFCLSSRAYIYYLTTLPRIVIDFYNMTFIIPDVVFLDI